MIVTSNCTQVEGVGRSWDTEWEVTLLSSSSFTFAVGKWRRNLGEEARAPTQKNIASRRAHISLYRVNAFGAPPHATDAVRVFRKGKKTGVLFVWTMALWWRTGRGSRGVDDVKGGGLRFPQSFFFYCFSCFRAQGVPFLSVWFPSTVCVCRLWRQMLCNLQTLLSGAKEKRRSAG